MSQEEAQRVAEHYRTTCRNGDRLSLASSIAEKLVTARIASSKYDATNLPGFIDALILEGKMSEEEAQKLAEHYRTNSCAKLNLASSVAKKLVTAGIASSLYDATNERGYIDALAQQGNMSQEEAQRVAERYRTICRSVSAKQIAAEKEARVNALDWSYEKVATKVRPGKLGVTIEIMPGGGAKITDINRACCNIVGNISVGDTILSIGRAGTGKDVKSSERQITSKADFAVDIDEWRRIVILTTKKQYSHLSY
jgi:polyhydroxyalkanoate synthesis regulator phasin